MPRLNIQKIEHLCKQLEVTPDKLFSILEKPDSFVCRLTLRDPRKPDKERTVIDVRGALRRLQNRFYKRVLLPKLWPSDFSHGGIRGRHIKTNVSPHVDSRFVFKTDISNFYPSIHRERVYRLFVDSLGCSPDVARACTRLCTLNHHLALGLLTSPILADQVLKNVDNRIAGACASGGLTYSRFVDDVTISGSFDLERSGFASLVERILSEHGFVTHPEKREFGRTKEGCCITGIQVRRGKIDVRREYAEELERQLGDAASLARGDKFAGPFYTKNQLQGRICFVSWVNPGRRKSLQQHMQAVDWERHAEAAAERGLVSTRVILTRQQDIGEAGCAIS